MNCIIVDDDKLSRSAIKQLIASIDSLNLKDECSDAIETYNCLKKGTIDLVFLDVEMRGIDGIELIKNLEKRPIIILISTKKDYAVEAFEFNVADYIIKPINPDRFSMAVARAKELLDVNNCVIGIDEMEKEYIFVRSNSILTQIKFKDIIYIHDSGDYVNIITVDKCNSVHCTLESIEEKLPVNKFYRLDGSCLVAMDHIDSFIGNTAD